MDTGRPRWTHLLLDSSGAPIGVAVLVLVMIALLFAATDPIPQDANYHLFADGSPYLSVPNFWNVMSNVPFFFVGLWGLRVLSRRRHSTNELRLVYGVFFVGVLLTAFGSAYYHLAPGNEPLVWDRLPMTIGIAGLFAAVIGEYASPLWARRLIIPFLLIGALSVFYWQWTERHSIGDLRPYAIVQFLPILVMPILMLTRGRRSTLTRPLWFMVGFYVCAKVFEHFDVQVFQLLPLSGHTLKHLFAAMGPAALAYGLQSRRPAHSSGVDR